MSGLRDATPGPLPETWRYHAYASPQSQSQSHPDTVGDSIRSPENMIIMTRLQKLGFIHNDVVSYSCELMYCAGSRVRTTRLRPLFTRDL